MLSGWSAEKMGSSYVMISPRVAAERHWAGNGTGEGGQPPGSVMNFDPRIPVVVMYGSPLPGLRHLHSRRILVDAGVVVRNMCGFPTDTGAC